MGGRIVPKQISSRTTKQRHVSDLNKIEDYFLPAKYT